MLKKDDFEAICCTFFTVAIEFVYTHLLRMGYMGGKKLIRDTIFAVDIQQIPDKRG
jgi:hypothetical protein